MYELERGAFTFTRFRSGFILRCVTLIINIANAYICSIQNVFVSSFPLEIFHLIWKSSIWQQIWSKTISSFYCYFFKLVYIYATYCIYTSGIAKHAGHTQLKKDKTWWLTCFSQVLPGTRLTSYTHRKPSTVSFPSGISLCSYSFSIPSWFLQTYISFSADCNFVATHLLM